MPKQKSKQTHPIHFSAKYNHIRVLRHYIDSKGDLDSRDEWGQTPLMVAASCAHVKSVKALIEAGADVRACDKHGCASLTLAANALSRGGDAKKVVQMLLEAGADMEDRGGMGRTALMLAAERDHVELVRYLLEQGADPEAEKDDALRWEIKELEAIFAAWNFEEREEPIREGDPWDADPWEEPETECWRLIRVAAERAQIARSAGEAQAERKGRSGRL